MSLQKEFQQTREERKGILTEKKIISMCEGLKTMGMTCVRNGGDQVHPVCGTGGGLCRQQG